MVERKDRAILNEVERRKDGEESDMLTLGVSELDGMSMLEGLQGPLRAVWGVLCVCACTCVPVYACMCVCACM